MKLTSSAFHDKTHIPKKYTCDGQNINPPLSIADIPKGTRSLALVMDDHDVPTYIRPDGTWDHWVIFNIPPDITLIEEGKEPQCVHGLGTGNNLKYYGPCPPDREHHYSFKLYALDTELNLPEKTTKKQLEQAMKGHILDETELTGVYGRS